MWKRKKAVTPVLRKNACEDFDGECLWQAMAPDGWVFEKDTTYRVSGKLVYLSMKKDE